MIFVALLRVAAYNLHCIMEDCVARRIIQIDEEKCTGCGLCAAACHEGAISIIEGKARLAREDFCDGLGDCLPACPAGAISFKSRAAPACSEEEVKPRQEVRLREDEGGDVRSSSLRQWPLQIKLVPATAPFFSGCELLIAADCTAYACAAVRDELMRGRVTLIGCPKLDGTDYSEKLKAIIAENEIKSVTVAKMEVPCCAGLQAMAEKALKTSGKALPRRVVTVLRDGGLRAELG